MSWLLAAALIQPIRAPSNRRLWSLLTLQRGR
nr:MAG TPA: hypothetical protein [Caudoviricetes sp.]